MRYLLLAAVDRLYHLSSEVQDPQETDGKVDSDRN